MESNIDTSTWLSSELGNPTVLPLGAKHWKTRDDTQCGNCKGSLVQRPCSPINNRLQDLQMKPEQPQNHGMVWVEGALKIVPPTAMGRGATH